MDKPPEADTFVPIGDLAVIGDQRSAALVDRAGRILWYCPGCFDKPSLLAGLLDPHAGIWSIEVPMAEPAGRSYIGGSGILQTHLSVPHGIVTLTDFMPMGPEAPAGVLCRMVTPTDMAMRYVLSPRQDYARGRVSLRNRNGQVLIGNDHRLHTSHPPSIDHDNGTIMMAVPPNEAGWMVLASKDLVQPSEISIRQWLDGSLRAWEEINGPSTYHGPYAQALHDSLRAIRLLTYAETGGVVAAVTTSLPEIIGGERNYDYRYVWLRDAGMVASALARAGTCGEGARFLEFLSSTHGILSDGAQPLAPLLSVTGGTAPNEELLTLAGYRDSRPVRIGNTAIAQLQLDAYGNLLVAAEAVFRRTGRIPQWPVIEAAANFLAAHWRDPEAGIWEEEVALQHTTSKAIAACGLQAMAEHAADPATARQWLRAVHDIKAFIAARCMTSEGAYAAIAGGKDVDITAALLSFWRFSDPASPAMRTTMALLDRDHCVGGTLYRRRLETSDAHEGIFLAGTLWAAKYWIAVGCKQRGREIIEAVLAFANDLGFLSEEADEAGGELLGNYPQIFVHAALIGAILDLEEG